MKWPGEAIWSILLPKNQTETEIFHFPFFHCFSPLSWLQVLRLLWNHCVLTKKIFWIVQVDFFELIFHLKPLSEHSGKIPVMVKNQGTSYLKLFWNQRQWKIDMGFFKNCCSWQTRAICKHAKEIVLHSQNGVVRYNFSVKFLITRTKTLYWASFFREFN